MDGNNGLETPRTRHRKEICQHRLAYFSTISNQNETPPVSQTREQPTFSQTKTGQITQRNYNLPINDQSETNTSRKIRNDDVLHLMVQDSRVETRNPTQTPGIFQNSGSGGRVKQGYPTSKKESNLSSHEKDIRNSKLKFGEREPNALPVMIKKPNSITQEFHFSLASEAKSKHDKSSLFNHQKDKEMEELDIPTRGIQAHRKASSVSNSCQSTLQLTGTSNKYNNRMSSPLNTSTESEWTVSDINAADEDEDVTDYDISDVSSLTITSTQLNKDKADRAMLKGEVRDASDVISISTDSDVYKSLDNDNLKVLLGQERFQRLLRNFEDEDEDDSDVSVFKPVGASEEDDLELKTHRPDVMPVSSLYINTNRSNPVWPPTLSVDQNNRTKPVIKCAFAVEEIYRSANTLTDVSCSYNMETKRQSVVEDLSGSVSDVSSSLVGREVLTLRQRPYGPIPQRQDRAAHTLREKQRESDTNCPSQHIQNMEKHNQESTASIQHKDRTNKNLNGVSDLRSKLQNMEEAKTAVEKDHQQHEKNTTEPHLCPSNDQLKERFLQQKESGFSQDLNVSQSSDGVIVNNKGDTLACDDISTDVISDVLSVRKQPTEVSDVYSDVKSIISQGADTDLTQRMERLGISLDFLKRPTLEPNYVIEKVVAVKRVPDDGGVLPQPTKSCGLPKPSLSDACQHKKAPGLVKICPKCAGINRPYMDWCTECGEVLIGIDPIPAALKSAEQCRVKKWLETEAEIEANKKARNRRNSPNEENTNETNFIRRGLGEDEDLSAPSKEELSLDLHNLNDTMKSLSRKETKTGPNKTEELKFVYEECSDPKKSLPLKLRAELSINIRDSTESSVSVNTKDNKPQNECIKKAANNKCKQNDNDPDTDNDNHNRVMHSDEHNGEPVNNKETLENEDIFKEFITRLKADSRFNPSAEEPDRSRTSKQRPRSAGCRRSLPSVQGKLQKSIDKQTYPRKWQTSASVWNCQDVSRSAAVQNHRNKEKRVTSAMASLHEVKRGSSPENLIVAPPKQLRPYSAGKIRSNQSPRMLSGFQSLEANLELRKVNPRSEQRISSSTSQGKNVVKTLLRSQAYSAMVDMGKYMNLAQGYTGKLYENDNTVQQVTKQTPSSRKHLVHSTVVSMSPRIQVGELSMMLCLPEEILLNIFSYLSHVDLIRCAAVCTHFKRIALDPSLWKNIVLKKRDLTDSWMVEIGSKKPNAISFIQCTGSKVTALGLRELFRQCGPHLTKLNFTGCKEGYLTGERILLHATNRCCYLTHIDTSWTNVDDCGVMALAESCHRLESLCLNGCLTISDEALRTVTMKHGTYLRTLELFGCFNLTQTTCDSITKYCKGLITLNLGQCWKIPNTSLCQLTASLGLVEHLDLRGCKQMMDSCVRHIVRNCSHLKTLALANCPNLTDTSLTEIATIASDLRSLDVCGCKRLTDTGVKAIASGCQYLEYLDISSTAITHKSITSLANYCNHRLEILKVNFCKQITVSCLVKLARHCHRLKKLYLYGVTGIRDTSKIYEENADLWIEM